MVTLRWTERSLEQLRSVHEWIAKNSPTQAGRIIEQIWQRTQVLSDFPRLGHQWQDEPGAEIRVLYFGHHRIAYRYDPDAASVDILGVYHGRMEISRHLEGN